MNTANLPSFDGLLQKTLHCSRYAKRLLETDPSLLNWLQENYTTPCNGTEIQALLQQYVPSGGTTSHSTKPSQNAGQVAGYPQPSPASVGGSDRVATATDSFDSEAGLAQAVRKLRKQVMVKLILRDLGGLADLHEVMSGMTALAELVLQRAQDCVMQSLLELYGSPLGASSGTTQQMLVIGMGKLGGGELNVSSDIDLIFVYPEDGETNGLHSPREDAAAGYPTAAPLPSRSPRKEDATGYPTAAPLPSRRLSNHEFFTRLGRRLINIINELTADGYVFRVDMRLRPYGDSGPLVMSFAALEEYLVAQGREWERYAWIKARVVSPQDCSATQELMNLVQPFVFRKYLDFGAFDSMRKLHAQIRQEVQRRDRANNIKLGPGGIREIEFIAQVFQLIRGGRNASLRIRPTLEVLQLLRDNGQLPAESVAALSAAYIFLRNLEHRLQYLDDQQTQDLPDKPDDHARLAASMGYPDYGAMLAQLDRHRALVSEQFAQIFSTQESDRPDSALWHDNMHAEELRAGLSELGYADNASLAEYLLHIRGSSRYRHLPESSRQRMDKLVPQFVALCVTPPVQQDRRKSVRMDSATAGTVARTQHNRDQTLLRMLKLLENIGGRASYLAFLAEYPQVLQRLVGIANASVWAFDYLIQHPILLDEFLDVREMYQPPQWPRIDLELQSRLNDCAGDTERQLDVLLHAQQEQIFHLLAMDLQGLLPLEKLSDYLSDLADLLLRHVLKLSWATSRKRHCDEPRFAIISYGKLGGKELGYASDLDLIFLYDDDHPDAQENYARLAQRINTMLGNYTSSGRLYETDLRLRPNGASGLLVSSVAAFAEYQQNEAWVWEHQALTRARFSAGDAQIGSAFEHIRQQVLCQKRDLATLSKEILDMRQKMHDGHPNDSDLFDIKHDSGGMVDIEFIVQYLVLAYAHQYPQLTANAGNLALLKLAGELGLIPVDIAEQTRALYRTLRHTQHRMRLNNISPCRVAQNEINTGASQQLWKKLFATE